MKKSLLWRDTKRIIKRSFKRLLLTSFLIAFLFYLFNIFAGLSLKLNEISSLITNKVGMYFYIQDSETDSDDIYKRIMNIRDILGQYGMKVEFSSKSDAIMYLENKMPEITKNFDKFGIENTLPSTLYVMFNNKKEYNIMKDVILANKDIIINVKDVDKSATLMQQENRSLRIIKITNLFQNSIYFIIIMLGITLITITQHILRNFFYDFYKEVEIKKILGATHKNVNGGFLLTLTFLMTIGFIIGFILTCSTFTILNQHLIAIDINLHLCSIVPKLLLSYLIFSLIAISLGYRMLKKMEKKF